MKTSNKLLLSLLVIFLIAITAFIGTAKHFHRKGVANTVKGDSNRSSEIRTVNDYTGIKIKGRIEVQLMQGQERKTEVNAAKNIVPLITTEVVDGILTIETKSRLDEEERVNVFITVPSIQSLDMSDGASIETTGNFTGDNLTINSSSGSNGQLNLQYKSLNCELSSGSELDIDGNAEKAMLKASSGAHIEAGDMITKTCSVETHSGANATVHASQELTASVNSGSVLNYRGDPAKTNINSSSGGTIRKR
jgi:hypothetical protein